MKRLKKIIIINLIIVGLYVGLYNVNASSTVRTSKINSTIPQLSNEVEDDSENANESKGYSIPKIDENEEVGKVSKTVEKTINNVSNRLSGKEPLLEVKKDNTVLIVSVVVIAFVAVFIILIRKKKINGYVKK